MYLDYLRELYFYKGEELDKEDLASLLYLDPRKASLLLVLRLCRHYEPDRCLVIC